jgi:hypothetical protein
MAAHKGPASLRPRCTRGGSPAAATPIYQSNIRFLLLLLLLLIKIAPVIAHCVQCYRIRPYIFRELNLHVVVFHNYNSSFFSFPSCWN